MFCHNKWGKYLFPRTKPTILVLLWMLFIRISMWILVDVLLHKTWYSLNTRALFGGAFTVVMLSVPVAGFLADAYWGQFRFIVFGLLTWWLVLIAVWIGMIFISTVGTDNVFPLLVYLVPACVLALIAIFVGLPGFVSNIIQFGMSQLPYAPSEEINIYIHWVVWTMLLGFNMAGITALVDLNVYWERTAPLTLTLMGLLVVIIGAIVLISIYCRHWFHTEYIIKNSYSLIWRVLNFARKHRTPVSRSALTYCENDPPSRIDLGKTKYGGPFTTEQVEDVKTFLRMLGLLLTTCPFFALVYILSLAPPGINCIPVSTNPFNASRLVIEVTEMLVIPINILVIYPMCRNYYPGALKRMGLGMVLLLSAVLIKLIITLTSIHVYQQQLEEFINCTTVFQNASQRVALFVPGFLTGISVSIFYPAFFGFICAQSPQKMMGILIGVSYVIQGLFMLLGEAFTVPALILRSKFSQNTYDWVTYLVCFVFGVGGLFLYTAVARLYKFRERDEEPKDQLYVEAYYDKIILNEYYNC